MLALIRSVQRLRERGVDSAWIIQIFALQNLRAAFPADFSALPPLQPNAPWSLTELECARALAPTFSGDLPLPAQPLEQAPWQTLCQACQDLETQWDWASAYTLPWTLQGLAAFTQASMRRTRKFAATELAAATQLFTPEWIGRFLVEQGLDLPQRRWTLDNLPRIMDPACGGGHLLLVAFEVLAEHLGEQGHSPAQAVPAIFARLYGLEIDPLAAAVARFALRLRARALMSASALLSAGEQSEVPTPQIAYTAQAPTLGALLTAPYEAGDLQLSPPAPGEGPHRANPNPANPNPADPNPTAADLPWLEWLEGRYELVLTNPPYLGRKSFDPQLRDYIRRRYPQASADLFAAFLLRCLRLLAKDGRLAAITMNSWMFLSSFTEFRRQLWREAPPQVALYLGTSAFPHIRTELVSTVAWVSQLGAAPETPRPWFDLQGYRGLTAKAQAYQEGSAPQYWPSAADFAAGLQARALFDLPPATLAALRPSPAAPPLGQLAAVKQGLATGNNAKFVRRWWEVNPADFTPHCADSAQAAASGQTWFPYNKGGTRAWYYHSPYVVNWAADGREIRAGRSASGRSAARVQNATYYFQPALTWAKIGNRAPSFSFVDPGHIFDVAGCSIFGQPADLLSWAAFLNSAAGAHLLAAISRTFNFEVGHISSLPIRPADPSAISETADYLVQWQRQWAQRNLAHWSARGVWLEEYPGRGLAEARREGEADFAAQAARARRAQAQLDKYFAALYDLPEQVLSSASRGTLTDPGATLRASGRLLFDLCTQALHEAFGWRQLVAQRCQVPLSPLQPNPPYSAASIFPDLPTNLPTTLPTDQLAELTLAHWAAHFGQSERQLRRDLEELLAQAPELSGEARSSWAAYCQHFPALYAQFWGPAAPLATRSQGWRPREQEAWR